jgi:site-specific DNA-methyltransferase (adenine-specific)
MGRTGRPLDYHLERPATTAERQQRWRQQHRAKVARLTLQVAQRAYLKSQAHTWPTPWDVFDAYNDEFAFTLDVCAQADSTKCAVYFSPAQDGLAQDWGREVCWMNPPYGRAIGLWMAKAYRASLAGATVVALIPARTGAGWWHDWVRDKAEIRSRKGRIRFVGSPYGATFDAAAVIYRPTTSL